jgi:hypothetical protein
MYSVTVSIRISAAEMLRFYAGQASEVVATATDGRSVRFPVHVLRPFVTEAGVSGTFRLRFTSDRRFVSIDRVSADRSRWRPW